MRPLRRDLSATLAAVFSRPTRLLRLAALGPRGWWWTALFLQRVVPQATRELELIRERAALIPDELLRAEALESIDGKAYHVQGGSILATFLPRAAARRYVALIAPLETIYDYLDNLCDRLPGVTPQAYGLLHEALRDAVEPARPGVDYYAAGPPRDDGGYLAFLVATVRTRIASLPSLSAVAPQLAESTRLYAELQTFKHLASGMRERACREWFEKHQTRFPGLEWWEFAAACGSSLPVFAMLFLASQADPTPDDVSATFGAYFPNVSALHILLDYYIDQAEDRAHGELNFFECYASSAQAVLRMRALAESAARRLGALASPARHKYVLSAMSVFYLTHPKVFAQHLERESAQLLAALS